MATSEQPGNAVIEILVVEDNPTQSTQLRRILEKNGYAVTVCCDGEAALDQMRTRRPVIVISDVLMPGMDGYQLCHEIKSDETLARTPVILLTVLSDPQDIIKGLESGADNFLTKPYDSQFLLARIQYILMNQRIRDGARPAVGLDIYFMGQTHHVTAERMQIVDLLISTYESAIQKTIELQKINEKLQAAIDHIKTLRGLIPICSGCKKIRDDQGYWQHLEVYLKDHSDADFTHSLCPECMQKHYPKYYKKAMDEAEELRKKREEDAEAEDEPEKEGE